MRMPRMTTRRWMVVAAIVAVLTWGISRAQALERRSAFHSSEKQSCLQEATAAEKRYHQFMEAGCILLPKAAVLEIAEDYEAAPELRERAEYHAQLEALYRRAARYAWIPVQVEKPFAPDGRLHSPEWLRTKANAYRRLAVARREAAKLLIGSSGAKAWHHIADQHMKAAADYDRRAALALVP